jgi:hypothetical protein
MASAGVHEKSVLMTLVPLSRIASAIDSPQGKGR